ncbi:MAG: DKNYY domain-containing protein [Desulfovibrionales bacterium]
MNNDPAFDIIEESRGKIVRFHGVRLPYIDAETFVPLGGAYGKDRCFGYWQGQVVQGCDLESFRHVADEYAGDKARIYRHGSPLPVDPATFVSLAHGYCKDAEHVYCYDRLVRDADPETAEVLSQFYLRDCRAVYHLEHEIKGVDPERFRLFDAHYGTDGERIYSHGRVLESADLPTFCVISAAAGELHYALDENHVYLAGEIITDADPETFEPLQGYFARDAARVYHYGYLLHEADAVTIRCLPVTAFCVDKDNIYFRNHLLAPLTGDFEIIPPSGFDDYHLETAIYYRYDGAIYSIFAEDSDGFHNRLDADPASFEYLGKSFARDKDKLFFFGTAVAGCDPDTFEDLGLGYYRDAESVFYAERKLVGADPDSFVIDYRGWSRDANRVYFETDVVPELSPDGFEVLGNHFVKDRRSVFSYDARMLYLQQLKDADADSFTVIDAHYSKDKERVYYISDPIPGADPATFEPVRFGYARDARSYYYQAEQRPGIDQASFTILSGEIATDKAHFYHYGRPVPCDANSFRVVDDFFCKDRSHVWFEGEPQEGIDAPTFERKTRFYYVDANRVYERQNPLPLDPGQVSFLDEAYAVTPEAVYFLDQPLPDADPKTFTVLAGNFSKDANRVYFREEIVEGADAESFEVVNYLESRDKHRVYTMRAGRVTVLRERS